MSSLQSVRVMFLGVMSLVAFLCPAGKRMNPALSLWVVLGEYNKDDSPESERAVDALDFLQSLLSNGVNPNDAVFQGVSALDIAIGSNNTAAVFCLLYAKADPNKRHEMKLDFAAQQYNESLAQKLSFAWPTLRPLHRAIICGHVDCIKLLIAAGADTQRASGDLYSPLETAQRLEEQKIPHKQDIIRLLS